LAKIIWNDKKGRIDILMEKNEEIPVLVVIRKAGGQKQHTFDRCSQFDKIINAKNNITETIHINTLNKQS